MKKLIYTIFLFLSSVPISAQTVQSAIGNLEAFVNSVNVTEQTTKAEIDSLNSQFRVLKDAYKAVKKQASDNDVQNYFRITACYKKKIAPYYAQQTSDTLDDTADKVTKWVRRQYKKAKGTVEGIKE